MRNIETVIVGGGQGGLATSYYLQQEGLEHLVLEQADRPANAWRNDRWDSFSLVTPNWTFRLPGAGYAGDDPGGYMQREEIIRRFEQYVDQFRLPVVYNTRVSAVEKLDSGRFSVQAGDKTIDAHNVVLAVGLFQQPRVPRFAGQISERVAQIPSGQYRNPRSLPPGAVLVVGSAQSGCQIAEELYQDGRKVYLSVGSAGRAPRRYRGKDIFDWLHLSGFMGRTVHQLPSPAARFAGNPHVTGKAGGHTINLHQFARDGVTLLGKLQTARAEKIQLAPGLKANLAKADAFEVELLKMIDEYIDRAGLDAPAEVVPALKDGFEQEEVAELDLKQARVSTIIWATGYSFDFGWVRAPVLDEAGFPIQDQGITRLPGLYFVGLPWMPIQPTGLLLGVAENAKAVAGAIAARRQSKGRRS